MHRRELLGVLGTSAAGLAALSGATLAGDDTKGKDAVSECGCKCVESCCDAMSWCNEVFLHSSRLVGSGKTQHAKLMLLLLDCGEVCSVTAKLVARESSFTAAVCQICAESCSLAAAECEKFDDSTMKDAAKSLRTCRDACLALLKALPKKASSSR